MKERGQGATELIIALAAGLIVLLIIISTSTSTLDSYKASFREDQVRDALDEIQAAAELVYQQGPEARTEVSINLPKSIQNSTVGPDFIKYTFYSGNEVIRTFDFNVTGDLPLNSGLQVIQIKSLSGQVLISTDVSTVDFCGNAICSVGEVCPADVGSCTDNVCYNPNCNNGCGETAITLAQDSGECDATTTFGLCTSTPCYCDATSVCVSEPSGASISVDFFQPTSNINLTQYNTSEIIVNVTCSVEDCGTVNVSLRQDGSLITDIPGATPFFSNGTMPRQISITAGNSQLVNFGINATGSIGSTYTVYAHANLSSGTGGGNATNDITVEIKEIIFLDLWPFNGEYPVAFTDGSNYTANTFWLIGENDGWDYTNGTYMGGPSSLDRCVLFNNDTAKLGILIGDGDCGSSDNNGQGSGAWGIEFYVNQSLAALIDGGASVNLSFDWRQEAQSSELDNNEPIWVKATIGNGTIFAYEDFESQENGGSYYDEGGWGWLTDWFYTGSGDFEDVTDEYSGRYAIRMEDDPIEADRSVDLSRATSPRIQFYAKADSLEGVEQIRFRVSPDDSSYTTLETWANGDDEDDTWRLYDFDLTPYFENSNEFWIEFDADVNNGNDEFYLDQIMIYEGTTTYLGSSLDATQDRGDAWNEIFFDNNPDSSDSGFESFDISSYIVGQGWYYLTLGGQVYEWDSNEGARFYFDNIQAYIE
jgi:hypothetical protein